MAARRAGVKRIVTAAFIDETDPTLTEQVDTIEWLRVYNQERPHDSLGRVPPHTFLPRPTTAEQSPWELSA